MWSALTPGRMMRATAEIIQREPNAAIERRVLRAEVGQASLEPRHAVPGERGE